MEQSLVELGKENETPQERRDRLFRMRQRSQLNLMQYQKETGVIIDIEDFVRLGLADLFDWLCKGKLNLLARKIKEINDGVRDETMEQLLGFVY